MVNHADRKHIEREGERIRRNADHVVVVDERRGQAKLPARRRARYRTKARDLPSLDARERQEQ